MSDSHHSRVGSDSSSLYVRNIRAKQTNIAMRARICMMFVLCRNKRGRETEVATSNYLTTVHALLPAYRLPACVSPLMYSAN